MTKLNPKRNIDRTEESSQDAISDHSGDMRSGFYYITKVARFEAKILWRSWMFRVFSILILSILILFNLFAVLGIAGNGWSGQHLPGNIVYFNFFIFTVAQVIIAAFLSADFLARERKLDTTEVFYTRPMSNFQYVAGKTLGALQVFLGLNMVVLFISILVSLLSTDTPFVVEPFLVFLFAFSIPSLLFILGFSFVLMILVRNQAVTFVIVLGFGGIVLFYLQNMHHGVWDFLGYYLPLHYSGFSGFSNLSGILTQRLLFLLLGLTGVLLTAYLLPRLPGQKKPSPYLPATSFVTIAIAGYLIFSLISTGNEPEIMRAEIRNHESALPDLPQARIDSCHLKVTHANNKITCQSELLVHSNTNDSLLFALNPGFTIENVTIEQQPATFTFEKGLLSIHNAPGKTPPDSTITCQITYSGAPDNQAMYPYVDESNHELLNRLDPLIAGKEYAFVQPGYLLLTRASGWYPVVAWKGFRQQAGFSNFLLEFQSQNNLQALSQGDAIQKGPWTRFLNDQPLNALTLIAGAYQVDSLTVDSIHYQIALHKRNTLYQNSFDQIADTLPSLIRDLKGKYERQLEMKYPFNRLKIVSVPIHFFTYLQPWSLSTDHTQPEFILVPEYGGGSWRLAVTRLHEDFTKEAQRQGNEPEEQEIQARMFILLTGNTFLYPQYMLLRRGQNINYPITNWNRTQVLPLYYNYAYQIQEPGLPTFQIMLEQALQERDNNRNPNNNQSQYQGLLALKRKCLAEWIQQGVMNDTTIELLNLSGIQFFSEVSALSPNGDFIDAFEYPLANFKFQNSSPDQWLNNADVSADLTSRYNSRMQKKKIPAFKFGHIETAEIKKEGKTKYFFSLEVFNYGEANGPLTTQTFFVDLSENRARSYAQWQYQNMTDDANVEKRLFNVPAKSKVRLEFVFDQLPGNLEINTNLSENIPPQYHFGLNFSENNHVQPNTGMVVLDSLIQDDESNKDKESGIYIVDNEDDGFTIDSKDEIRTLKDWWLQRKSNKIKEYSGFNHWNPNPVWSSSLNTNYHGEYLRSAVFKAAGNGKDRARWRCNLKEAGNYEVQVHIPNELHTRWRQRDVPAEFNYHIHHANGSSTFTTPNLRNRTGWISLGHFFFNEGEAVVELSDKTEFPYVVADAAKWIKR